MRILYLPNSQCQQRQLEKPNFLAYPVRLAIEAQKYRNEGHEVLWDCSDIGGKTFPDKIIEQPENLPFLSLPHPDRVWTKAKDEKYQRNGNFKYHPGTYIMSASGCWHSKCSFCVEQNQLYEVRPVEDVISEIEEIKAQGYKEVFDDSATFPTGRWLDEFTRRMECMDMVFSCNMRMCDIDYVVLKKAHFRMLLFGLESANQQTLDRINKEVKVEDVKYIIQAARAGLEPHIAVMFGFPWESDADAMRTLKTTWYLLRKGYAKTAQASFYTPPDGRNQERHRKFVHQIYRVSFSPEFWFNQLKDIRNKDDIKYLWRKIKSVWR